ncbi:hypothetical protein SS50377_26487 [Spironucleus salmonicida]|uniref:Uncharacterized protein n=1 Tax=Spironucleus salmonicida TaxID=348837 RepID=V6LAU2_9EUKA|nr:hypothetical protein SS50377_26487 [Spironucleus salmonicida]|eukprot:EST41343.1 hypothetical protein SS50377_19056 [Spironucleus salmonicida]
MSSQITLRDKYFSPLRKRLEKSRPSPGPAAYDISSKSDIRQVQRSDRNIQIHLKTTETPAPFISHSPPSSRPANITKTERWSPTKYDNGPGPNQYKIQTQFLSTEKRARSPEFNGSERFQNMRREKRPEYYNKNYSQVLPSIRGVKLTNANRATDSWIGW